MLTQSARRGFAQSLGAVFLANAGSAFLGFLILALLARTLSPSEFGLLAPIISVLDIAQVLIDAIVTAGAVHVAVRKLKTDRSKAEMAFKIAFAIRIGVALAVGVCAFPFAPWLSEVLYDTPDMASEIRLVLLTVPALAISLSAIAVLQAEQQFVRLSVVTLYKNTLRFSILFALAVLQFLSVETAIWAICLAMVATAVLAVLTAPFGYVRQPGFDWEIAGEMFQVNKWMVVMVVGYVGGRIDIFMLSSLSDAEQVGWYAAAFQLCIMITLISQSLITTLFPSASALETVDAMRSYFRRSLRLGLMVLIPYGALVVLSPWVTPLILGEAFTEAAPVLTVLAGSAFLTMASNPLILLLFPLGEVRILALSVLAQVVFRVALNLYAMPQFGALGGAGVELIVKALTVGVAVYAVDRLLRKRAGTETPLAAAPNDRPKGASDVITR